ncbi:MAG: GWxTD domain-containing protein [Candidatus Zixiibacteriota bacterium]|nr:MAG: GWxTD domain-containing protein [candidate division Zixibacteria bacterium]
MFLRVLFLAVALPVWLLAFQVVGQESSSELAVYTNAVVYNDPTLDPRVLLEFPFVLNHQQFELYRADSTDEASYSRIFVQVTLYGTDGLPIDSSNTYFSSRASSSPESEAEPTMLFNRLWLMVEPGVYSARVSVVDVVSKATGERFIPEIVVGPSVSDRLNIGGGCLAYRLTYVGDETTSDRNVRNGLRVLVSPLGAFAATDSAVYLYAELHNLTFSDTDSSSYRLAYAILDDEGGMVRDLGYKMRTKPGESAVIAQQIDIEDRVPGKYQVRLIADDMETGQGDTALYDLVIISEAATRIARSTGQATDPYDTLSLESKEQLVAYHLEPGQKLLLSRLTPEGKENFLEQYWRENDDDPLTPIIENRLEMIDRFNFANRYFSITSEEADGWSTDRGRIYMTHGPWEERVDVQAPTIGNPYVVWYYHSKRREILFVFEDREGFQDYRLVHSNMEGERFSREWDERLKTDDFRMR